MESRIVLGFVVRFIIRNILEVVAYVLETKSFGPVFVGILQHETHKDEVRALEDQFRKDFHLFEFETHDL